MHNHESYVFDRVQDRRYHESCLYRNTVGRTRYIATRRRIYSDTHLYKSSQTERFVYSVNLPTSLVILNAAITAVGGSASQWSAHLRPYGHSTEETRFTDSTDHDALRWLVNLTEFSGRLGHGRLGVAEFDITIEYRSGRVRVVPDALSWLMMSDGPHKRLTTRYSLSTTGSHFYVPTSLLNRLPQVSSRRQQIRSITNLHVTTPLMKVSFSSVPTSIMRKTVPVLSHRHPDVLRRLSAVWMSLTRTGRRIQKY